MSLSLRAMILQIVEQATRPLAQPEIYARLSRAVDKNVFCVTIAQMRGTHLKRRKAGKRVHAATGGRFVYWSKHRRPERHWWIPAEDRSLRTLYPHCLADDIARILGRTKNQVYARARKLDLEKSAEFMASPLCNGHGGYHQNAVKARFQKGHVPANKGLRRPGWFAGRMRETQFKKGHFPANRDPDTYVLGALRVNTDGYIDMRVSFEPGANGWRGLHLILWEDARGPIPPGHCLWFRNRDKLDVQLDNLELITRAENCRRNSIHRLPAALKASLYLLGQLKRRIREKQDRRSTQSPVCHA